MYQRPIDIQCAMLNATSMHVRLHPAKIGCMWIGMQHQMDGYYFLGMYNLFRAQVMGGRAQYSVTKSMLDPIWLPGYLQCEPVIRVLTSIWLAICPANLAHKIFQKRFAAKNLRFTSAKNEKISRFEGMPNMELWQYIGLEVAVSNEGNLPNDLRSIDLTICLLTGTWPEVNGTHSGFGRHLFVGWQHFGHLWRVAHHLVYLASGYFPFPNSGSSTIRCVNPVTFFCSKTPYPPCTWYPLLEPPPFPLIRLVSGYPYILRIFYQIAQSTSGTGEL